MLRDSRIRTLSAPKQVLEVDQKRLDLDDHERSGPGLERQQIDPSALAPLVEARLELCHEVAAAEPGRQRLDDRGVFLVRYSMEVASATDKSDLDAQIEHRRMTLEGVKRARPAAFVTPDCRRREACPGGDVLLWPVSPNPEHAEQASRDDRAHDGHLRDGRLPRAYGPARRRAAIKPRLSVTD